jgi:hypothetical protein
MVFSFCPYCASEALSATWLDNVFQCGSCLERIYMEHASPLIPLVADAGSGLMELMSEEEELRIFTALQNSKGGAN